MTFDEAIKYAKENSFVEEMLSDAVYFEDVIEILENLKKEYAPTVKMTQEQKEYYASRTLLSGMAFNQNTQYYTDEVYNIDRKIASAILHPETIKIVDEQETSGKVYGNLQDANWNCHDMGVKTGAITQVFEFIRPMPISGDIKRSEKLKDMIRDEY